MRLAVLDFGPFATAGMRVLIASLFLVPIMLWRGHGETFAKHWRPVLLVGPRLLVHQEPSRIGLKRPRFDAASF